MKNKNIVVLDKRDEWSKFSEFMAGIYAKYADEVGLDDLPDPEVLFYRNKVMKMYKAYMRHVNREKCRRAHNDIEYGFCW
ncbi:hypothetical protein [Butyrivibrio sp. M55]|uniref:hypothetical protein n=1 Tax=Butyrivibrio sp. M55 TaxID=1855323 RepID=UPI0008F32A92|nr:hypothetical protein [Butyrivibrio sp. M55]SFU81811.1 hypothetical protein SAMN05216540_11187 [Butyrivibrio sp. M55]